MVVISGTLLLLTIIALAISGTLTAAYVRDAVTKGYESEIALDRNETFEEIMNSGLPDDEKTRLLMEFLSKTAPSGFDFGELGKYIPIVVGGYVAAAMLGGKK